MPKLAIGAEFFLELVYKQQLTDPSYSDLECYSKLAELAAEKMKPEGLCLAYAGQFKLPDIMRVMGEHLIFWWMISVRFTGGCRLIHARNVQQTWKPVLLYAKGKPNHDIILDSVNGCGSSKDRHDWEKPEGESAHLIEKLTQPGDLVVDPFVGSGTTLSAAKKLGRDYLSCEIDKNTARGARRRLAA